MQYLSAAQDFGFWSGDGGGDDNLVEQHWDEIVDVGGQIGILCQRFLLYDKKNGSENGVGISR